MTQPELKMVSIDQINIDSAYQRTLNVSRVDRVGKRYSQGAVKAVSLSRRADGSLWVYDGQHTLALAVQNGATQIPAVIVDGDQKQEAQWFNLINGAGVAKANVRDRHRAALAADDPVAQGVQALLNQYSVVESKHTHAGHTTAIGSITGWFKSDLPRLERVFAFIHLYWGKEDCAWTQVAMRAVWDIASDRDELQQVFMGARKHKVTPRRLLDSAAAMQGATGVNGGGSGFAALALRKLTKTVRK